MDNTDNYITIFFINNAFITRKTEDVFNLNNYKHDIDSITPAGQETLVNWDNVAWVRKATENEIERGML